MKVENWGLISYASAHEKQLRYLHEIILNKREETIIICHHAPVVTLGKKTPPSYLSGWTGETISIERGGQATYHGPSQVMAYPIVNLRNRKSDIGGFLNSLEQSTIKTLFEYQLYANGNNLRGNPELTGVWINQKKIASIGIAIKKWVTYHGLAVNIFKDHTAFQGINPCGYESKIMTSLEEEAPQLKFTRANFESKLAKNLLDVLE